MDILGRLVLALALTVVIEGCVAYVLGLRTRRSMAVFVLINVITNPALNYLIVLLAYLGIQAGFVLIAALEVLVVLVEWQLLVYALEGSRGRFLIISALANTTSFLLGLLLF